jgi:hypothetical protein
MVLVVGFLTAIAVAQSSPQSGSASLSELRKAAEQGDSVAQYNLGVTYAEGQEVSQDFAEAARWYRKAADQGLVFAQLNLGLMYATGQGVPQDYAEAVRWYRKAADQGYAGAQASLGVMYDRGWGVPQDYAEAVRWHRKAADQGDAAAQYSLGVMYDRGRGVPQDYAEAVRWYRKAADQGLVFAQLNLGVMYQDGRGVPQDYAEAYVWFNLAASRASGDVQKKSADARESVAGKMTTEQVAEAQRRAREWKPPRRNDTENLRPTDYENAALPLRRTNVRMACRRPSECSPATTRSHMTLISAMGRCDALSLSYQYIARLRKGRLRAGSTHIMKETWGNSSSKTSVAGPRRRMAPPWKRCSRPKVWKRLRFAPAPTWSS